MRFVNESDRPTLPEDDFRSYGLLFFYEVIFICNLAQEAINNAKSVFTKENFINGRALSRE
jgi:hypothetical protein